MENLPIKTIMTVNVLWEVQCVPVYAPLPRLCHHCEEWQHRWRIVIVWVVNNNAGSRPWDKKRGRSSRSLDKGGGAGLQKIFSTLRALVWSKNKAGTRAPPRASPLDPPLNKTQGWTMHPLSGRAVHSLAALSLGVTQQIRTFCAQGEMDH